MNHQKDARPQRSENMGGDVHERKALLLICLRLKEPLP